MGNLKTNKAGSVQKQGKTKFGKQWSQRAKTSIKKKQGLRYNGKTLVRGNKTRLIWGRVNLGHIKMVLQGCEASASEIGARVVPLPSHLGPLVINHLAKGRVGERVLPHAPEGHLAPLPGLVTIFFYYHSFFFKLSVN